MLVTHLTRMGTPNICVAGYVVTSFSASSIVVSNHVRPVRVAGQLDKTYLNIFKLGNIVNLGQTQNMGQPPEIEDCSFNPASATVASNISKEQFLEALEQKREMNLESLFGPHLMRHDTQMGFGAAVQPGNGTRSLGELETVNLPELYINGNNHLRLRIEDPTLGRLKLPVTDVRFYSHNEGNWALETQAVERIAQCLHDSSPNQIILSVGLTREFHGVHWLQVNNIFLKGDPFWV